MKNFILFTFLLFLASCTDNPKDSGVVNSSTSSSSSKNTSSSSSNYEQEAESPNIKIKIDGMQAGRVDLIGIFTDRQFRIDSARMNASGEVTFKRDEPYRQGQVYVLFPDKSNIQMMMSTDQTFSLHSKVGDLKGAMKVTGSLDNELFYKNAAFEAKHRSKFSANTDERKKHKEGTPEYERLVKERDALLEERKKHLNGIFTEHPNTLFAKFKQAGQNPVAKEILNSDGSKNNSLIVWDYRNRFWDNVDFNDERLLSTSVVSNKLKRYFEELTPQNPDSIVNAAIHLVDKVVDKPEYLKYFANWIVLNYDPEETTLMDPQAVFVNMAQRYFTYERAFWNDSVETYAIQQRAHEMAASLVGKKGPDVKAPGTDGKIRSIYDIKTPYVVVYMYNPDCENCAKETPKLVEYYSRMKKEVEVYAIAINTENDKWKEYINKNGMQGFVNVHDPSNKAIYATYYVDHTPELYLLNPDRVIIGKNLHVHQIDTVIGNDKEKKG